MAKTNVQRNASYYDRIIKEAEKSAHGPHYKKVCIALKGLIQLTNRLNDPKHEMSPKEYEAISKRYVEVQDACKEYLAGKSDFDDYEQKREGIITDISSVVDKDMAVLLKCDPLKPGSLSEVMDRARTRKIIIDENSIKKVGDALSSRIPLITNSGKKGFFTAKSVYNQDEEWKKEIEKFEDKFSGISEECKKKLELLKSNEEAQNAFSFRNPEFPLKQSKRNHPTVKNIMYHLAIELGMGKSGPEIKEVFSKNKGLYDTLFDFANAMSSITRRQGVMAVSGMKKGDVISSRNCAMSDVAKMLGCQNLIANSEPMKIEINGKMVEGVFMEAAEGSDVNNLKENDMLMQAKASSFKSKEALQQLADLQVLDFICGNTDRHMGNLFYKFEKDSKGEVKFVGIQGIDNDCSFGRIKTTPGKSIMRMVNPEDMRYISEDMATRLNDIKKEMLQLKLTHNDLSAPEIEGVWERFQKVHEAVKLGKIKIVNKEYWEKHHIVVDKNEKNYLSYMKNMAEKCADNPKNNYYKNLYNKNAKVKDKVSYAKEIETASEIMAENGEKIKDLRKMMDDAKTLFSTSEYKLMEKSFKNIENLTNRINENYPNKREVPEDLTNALRNAYIEMHEKTERYVSLKKLVPYTERGQKRVNVAKALKKISETTLDKLGVKFEKENEKNREDNNIGKDTKENDGPEL